MRTCIHCGSLTKNPRFCSRSCAARENNKSNPKRKVEGNCFDCNAPIPKSHKRCDDCHSRRSISNMTLSQFTDAKNLGSNRYGSIRFNARNVAKNLKDECFNCGYSKHVEVCHIVDIKDHHPNDTVMHINRIENLIKLCPNCHWEFDNGILELVESPGYDPGREQSSTA